MMSQDFEENVEKKDLERTLDKLYRCRDMEITNLWQRSIFLTVFLTLTLSGYGILVSNFFTTNIFIYSNYKILHLAAIAIGLLGYTLSVIWILMAKGSKAWYEVYAKAISEFEEEFRKELGIPQIYLMGKVDFLDRDMQKKNIKGYPINKKLSNIDSGAYSVSKLNILIGWVFLIVWGSVITVHGSSYIILLSELWGYFVENILVLYSISIIIAFCIFVILSKIIVRTLKKVSASGYLMDSKYRRANREIYIEYKKSLNKITK